ncbi:DUF3618 domain-containing protein [Pseudonocardia sp. CA-107938]|uniref:DUF3618 domain-containing protein n=1 Tax=Pseudonocardia sp. CA-107938 TaxID=3240021 RepID=UPI003D8A579C
MTEKAGKTQAELRADIDEVRAEIGDTVGELAGRVDVPARVKAKKDEAAALVAEKAPSLDRMVRQRPTLVAGIAVVVFIGWRILSRRRSGAG